MSSASCVSATLCIDSLHVVQRWAETLDEMQR
jgi:hypothetical protein